MIPRHVSCLLVALALVIGGCSADATTGVASALIAAELSDEAQVALTGTEADAWLARAASDSAVAATARRYRELGCTEGADVEVSEAGDHVIVAQPFDCPGPIGTRRPIVVTIFEFTGSVEDSPLMDIVSIRVMGTGEAHERIAERGGRMVSELRSAPGLHTRTVSLVDAEGAGHADNCDAATLEAGWSAFQHAIALCDGNLVQALDGEVAYTTRLLPETCSVEVAQTYACYSPLPSLGRPSDDAARTRFGVVPRALFEMPSDD